ncbi:Reticulon-domain-containing protein [Kalaharituber pfeilii]|nr:Reticulon-domain-containing protein [Kalaharituber pfeilii]
MSDSVGLETKHQEIANGSQHPHSDQDSNTRNLDRFHTSLYDLVTWKYPRATSFIFLSILSTIFAFRFVNVMRYVLKAAYILLGSVAALEYAGKPMGYKGVVSQLRPIRYYTIPRESLEGIFDEIHDFLNFVIVEFQRVVFVENIFVTVVAFVTSFIGYFLIKYLPFWSLAFLATIAVFSGPYIYLNNQELIDAQINHYSEIANHKFIEARGYSEQYAGEAVHRARATATQLTEKVQNYTSRRASGQQHVNANNFPSAPTHEPAPAYQSVAHHEQPAPIAT